MSRTAQTKRRNQSVEAQLALAARALKGAKRGIDAQIERACELEVEHALALYKCGKASLHDAEEVMAEARRRVG